MLNSAFNAISQMSALLTKGPTQDMPTAIEDADAALAPASNSSGKGKGNADAANGASTSGANGDESAEADEGGDEEGGDGEEEEEEYEIEDILSHELGRFQPGQMAYLVSWKGYGEADNSWVRDEDAANAREMLDEYWKRNPRSNQPKKTKKKGAAAGRKSESREAPASASSSRKRGAAASVSASPAPKRSRLSTTELGSAKKRGRASKAALPEPQDAADEDEADDAGAQSDAREDETVEERAERKQAELERKKAAQARKKYESIADWDNIVKNVETIEKNEEGKLVVFLLFESGERMSYEAPVCNHRCPQKMLQFYESHLRFKTPAAKPGEEEAGAAEGNADAMVS